MCGILCILNFIRSQTCTNNCLATKETIQLLDRRGPDRRSHHIVNSSSASITFSGHVLWQQGDEPCVQPIVQDKNVLLMNGDVYTKRDNPSLSDTRWLFNRILKCETDEDFTALFRTVKGPLSVVYFNPHTNALYFFRDSLGRQSLLLGKSGEAIMICSVASNKFEHYSFIELPPLGIYKLDLSSETLQVSLYPWQPIDTHEMYHEQLAGVQTFLGFQVQVLEPISPQWLLPASPGTSKWTFESLLADRMFSSTTDTFNYLLTNPEVDACCDTLSQLLGNSIRNRCLATPSRCKNCIQVPNYDACNHCRIGILFSGGLDCTIMATFMDRFIDIRCPIDLLNVSFEKVSRSNMGKNDVNASNINYDTPDRLSARNSLEELQRLCPNRKWNLIESNITRVELQSLLPGQISALLHPMDTVLDESLGAALWFATRGRSSSGSHYSSPCRVLLVGSGADELFGGYTRHRNAFCRNGGSWQKLNEELAYDWVRLPSRNLARDDRVIGDHGVTARSPYVEESLTHFVRSLDATQKCLHTLEQGVGDKLLLRLCAFRMGLRNVCWMRKRALQFGSRIADSKQNAKDKSNAF